MPVRKGAVDSATHCRSRGSLVLEAVDVEDPGDSDWDDLYFGQTICPEKEGNYLRSQHLIKPEA